MDEEKIGVYGKGFMKIEPDFVSGTFEELPSGVLDSHGLRISFRNIYNSGKLGPFYKTADQAVANADELKKYGKTVAVLRMFQRDSNGSNCGYCPVFSYTPYLGITIKDPYID